MIAVDRSVLQVLRVVVRDRRLKQSTLRVDIILIIIYSKYALNLLASNIIFLVWNGRIFASLSSLCHKKINDTDHQHGCGTGQSRPNQGQRLGLAGKDAACTAFTFGAWLRR
jgi:hypothetical protein